MGLTHYHSLKSVPSTKRLESHYLKGVLLSVLPLKTRERFLAKIKMNRMRALPQKRLQFQFYSNFTFSVEVTMILPSQQLEEEIFDEAVLPIQSNNRQDRTTKFRLCPL